MVKKIVELSARQKKGAALALDYFKDVCVAEEAGKNVGTDIWSNPSKLLKAVGLGEDFVGEAPFKYLKTNAYIWEYSLLHLCMQLYPKKIVVQKDQYDPLLEESKHVVRPERFIGHGPGNVTRWKNLYKWDLPKDNVDEAVRELGKKALPFCEYLLNRGIKRGIGIRDYGKTKPAQQKYIRLRKEAASAFCRFLIAGKGKVANILPSEDDKKRKKYDFYDLTLCCLLSNSKGGFSKHVLAVSLLRCLYGRLRDKKNEKKLYPKLVTKLIPCLKKYWTEKGDIQNDVIAGDIIAHLERSKETLVPSLSDYYDFRQHMNVFKRINIWLDFLAETYEKGCGSGKNVEVISCNV